MPADTSFPRALDASPGGGARSGEDRALASALAAMPTLAPPASQWARVAIEMQRRKRARALRRSLAFATAAVLAAACVLPFVPRERGAADPSSVAVASAATEPAASASLPASEDTDLIARNQWLEAMARAQGDPLDAGSAYASAEIEDLIGMVDVALSGASEPGRRTALWQQRLTLMQELVSVRTQGLAVVSPNEGAGLVPASYQID